MPVVPSHKPPFLKKLIFPPKMSEPVLLIFLSPLRGCSSLLGRETHSSVATVLSPRHRGASAGFAGTSADLLASYVT